MDTTGSAPALPATFAEFKASAGEKHNAIAKMRYSHDAMVDMIVANPWISQAELAVNFGYTEGWVSQVIASDAFQAKLSERKGELVDPTLRATIEERFKGLVARSLDILMRKLEKPIDKIDDETALRAVEVGARALGYGSKGAGVTLNQQFVVAVPGKSASSDDWLRQHGAVGSAVGSPPVGRIIEGNSKTAVLVAPGSDAPTPDSKLLLAELKGA